MNFEHMRTFNFPKYFIHHFFYIFGYSAFVAFYMILLNMKFHSFVSDHFFFSFSFFLTSWSPYYSTSLLPPPAVCHVNIIFFFLFPTLGRKKESFHNVFMSAFVYKWNIEMIIIEYKKKKHLKEKEKYSTWD